MKQNDKKEILILEKDVEKKIEQLEHIEGKQEPEDCIWKKTFIFNLEEVY